MYGCYKLSDRLEIGLFLCQVTIYVESDFMELNTGSKSIRELDSGQMSCLAIGIVIFRYFDT